jgi:hypothetical protein
MTDNAPRDNDFGKGAVESDKPEQETNMAAPEEQLDHRDQDTLNKMNDSDFPQAGQHGEHSGQVQGKNQFDEDTKAGENCEPKERRRDPDGNAEGELQYMDPGQKQKRNQGGKKDDDLAA